jgi:hypothetical protein
MKNITRLALAFAVAAIACLSPMAHADEAQPVAPGEPGIRPERFYFYRDKDGQGTMIVKAGPVYNWGRPITVTISQNGKTFSGEGWRTLASEQTKWFAYCEFWVYGSGISAKFTGYITVMGVPDVGGGAYFLNGYSSPYWWECVSD